jgi:tetrahydromethanopterin S-methyltransferase subunit G
MGTIIIVPMLFVNKKKIVQSLFSGRHPEPSIVAEVLAVIMFMCLFFRHGDKTAYLIPIIPFFYLLIARWFPLSHLFIICIAVISYSFFSIETKGGESGKRKLSLKLTKGIVLQDFYNRKSIDSIRNNITNLVAAEKAVLMMGAVMPNFVFNNKNLVRVDEIPANLNNKGVEGNNNIYKTVGRDIYLVYALDKNNVESLQREGWEIFMYPIEVPTFCMNTYKYDPYKIGIKKLPFFD